VGGLEIPAGRVFADCVVERLLGRGGMGAAYLARQQPHGRLVVLKFLAPELATDPALRERFLREGRAQQKAPGPHVVQVHGVHEENGAAFLVMEYVEGRTAAELMRERGGRLPPLEAARIARDVARGLATIHAQGLVHRDIKPENVMVTPDGAAKILDFGLAKDVFQSGLTAPGQLLGTSYYMAPEQWDDDQEETARSDLFALGATLYRLVVGRPPFVGADFAETAELAAEGDYPPMRAAVPGTPEDLARIVAQLLMAEPAHRYALADACADDLERVLQGRPADLPRLVVEAPPELERRVLLVPGTRWRLGRDGACDVTIDHPTVSRRHAEVRRGEDGFRLTDLKSSHGTFVGDVRLEQPRLLQDGDAVRLGDVVLRFHDARRQERAFGLDVRREAVPAAALDLLLRQRDPRTLLVALERLAPDPVATERARVVLRGLVGDEVAAKAAQRVEEADLRARAGVPAFLAAVSGADVGADAAAWLVWWARARLSHPVQLAAAGEAPPPVRLDVVAGAAQPASLALAGQGLWFLGRDEKCHLRLADPGVARLHATLLRLHRRLVVVDGGHPLGTEVGGQRVSAAFVGPGDTLALGGVRVALRADPATSGPRVARGLAVIDPASFQALEALEHPAVAAALVALQRDVEALEWPARAAQALFEDPARAQAFARDLEGLLRRRAEAARPLLARLLGAAASDAAGWEALLARRADLPAPVAPAGWLSFAL
jgi:serine/threonine protein kinase